MAVLALLVSPGTTLALCEQVRQQVGMPVVILQTQTECSGRSQVQQTTLGQAGGAASTGKQVCAHPRLLAIQVCCQPNHCPQQ